MSCDEREKYEIVWARVDGYGKDWMTPTLAPSIKGWLKKRLEPGSTVTDFGCGNGSSLKWLESIGCEAVGIEIARNATTLPNVIYGDLRAPLNVPPSDYGICTDVMEHIPPSDVDTVLSLISSVIRKSAFFVIARDEDKDGAAVGQALHLTRKPKDWWDARLARHFSRVEVLRYCPDDETAYCLWAHK